MNEPNASTTTNMPRPLGVAIAGLGTIGKAVARRLDEGIPGVRLAAVATRDAAKARVFLDSLQQPVPLVPLAALPQHADIVIECAPAALLAQIAAPVLIAGKKVIVLSVGALLDEPQLEALAREHGGQILVPTGALIGLDAVSAAAEGTIHSVRMATRKPIAGLAGAPFLRENNIDISTITRPLKLFSGTARDAAKGFPANLNVAVALSLAGIGPDRTQLEIWADPTVTRNTHHIEVDADCARFSMTIENVPSENPRTGRITALSVIALLRKLSAPVRVGT
jgi:aspartate dehydrogenase